MNLAEKHRKHRSSFEQVRIKAQLACKHRRVLDAPYESSFATYPPFRVCEKCGFCETGWSCGYQILCEQRGREIVSTNRDKARDAQVGSEHPNNRFVRVGDIRDKKKLYEMAVRGESWDDDD